MQSCDVNIAIIKITELAIKTFRTQGFGDLDFFQLYLLRLFYIGTHNDIYFLCIATFELYRNFSIQIQIMVRW